MIKNLCIPGQHVRKLIFASKTDKGKKRLINEDTVLRDLWPDGSTLLAVIADGMGGHAKGEVASEIAAATFAEYLQKEIPESKKDLYEFLLKAFYHADLNIREKAVSAVECSGMGATIVAAIITPEQCLHLHAGDCRLYHFRNGVPLPIYVTKDHSIMQILLDLKKISVDEISDHPKRSIVTSSLGSGSSGLLAEPFLTGSISDCPAFFQLEAGDTVILTSDGLHSDLDVGILNDLVARYGSNPEMLVDKAVEAALEAGGEDNISIIAIHVIEEEIVGRENKHCNIKIEIQDEKNDVSEEPYEQPLTKVVSHSE